MMEINIFGKSRFSSLIYYVALVCSIVIMILLSLHIALSLRFWTFHLSDHTDIVDFKIIKLKDQKNVLIAFPSTKNIYGATFLITSINSEKNEFYISEESVFKTKSSEDEIVSIASPPFLIVPVNNFRDGVVKFILKTKSRHILLSSFKKNGSDVSDVRIF